MEDGWCWAPPGNSVSGNIKRDNHIDAQLGDEHNVQSGDKLARVGGIYTGCAISHDIQLFINVIGLKPRDVRYICPLSIILFIGNSHTDLFGSLVTTPVPFTFAIYSIKFH